MKSQRHKSEITKPNLLNVPYPQSYLFPRVDFKHQYKDIELIINWAIITRNKYINIVYSIDK